MPLNVFAFLLASMVLYAFKCFLLVSVCQRTYLVMSGLEVSRILPQRFCCKDNIYLNTFQQNHVKFKKSYENMVLI